MIALIVVVVIVVLLLLVGLWGVASYNGLIKLRNRVQEAWRVANRLTARQLIAIAKGESKLVTTSGDTVVLNRARPLALTVDGVRRDVYTTALSVDGARYARLWRETVGG